MQRRRHTLHRPRHQERRPRKPAVCSVSSFGGPIDIKAEAAVARRRRPELNPPRETAYTANMHNIGNKFRERKTTKQNKNMSAAQEIAVRGKVKVAFFLFACALCGCSWSRRHVFATFYVKLQRVQCNNNNNNILVVMWSTMAKCWNVEWKCY